MYDFPLPMPPVTAILIIEFNSLFYQIIHLFGIQTNMVHISGDGFEIDRTLLPLIVQQRLISHPDKEILGSDGLEMTQTYLKSHLNLGRKSTKYLVGRKIDATYSTSTLFSA